MDFGSKTTQPPVTPLLVELYDSHKLYQLAGSNTPAARFELCEIVSDILASSIKISEHELIADILIGIVRQAEHDLKQALADRLSVMDNAPLRLLLRLTEEDSTICAPILRNSPVLNDLDLMYIIQSRSADCWRAIAGRKTLNAPVVDSLAETRDAETASILAENPGAPLSDKAQSIISDIACDNEQVARSLLQRSGLSKDIARKLYQHVAADLQKIIENEFDITSSEVHETMQDVLKEFTQVPDESYRPTSAMIKAAALFAEKGQLDTALMIATLKRGQVSSFVAQFARYCGLSVSAVLSMLQQPQGHGLALASRLCEISRDDFAALFVLSQRMVSKNGLVNYKDIDRAIAYHDRISKDLAERVLRGCRQH